MSEPQPSKLAVGRKLFMKQPNMLRVLYALVAVLFAGIYFFGWRVLAVLVVCNVAGLATEWLTSRKRGQPISTACFVTCWLYGLSLPPAVPLWIAAVGIVVAILFGKEVFGGFGRNFANPAIVGRAFVYVCFPRELTGQFLAVFKGLPGGFAAWSMAGLKALPAHVASAASTGADAMTAATPMWARRDFAHDTPIWDLFSGNVGGTFQAEGESFQRVLAAGSIGEMCVGLLLLAGVYLIVTKTANWRLTLSTLAGAAGANVLFRNILGIEAVGPMAFTFCAGALVYAAVFMVTDPVSAPKHKGAMYAYGAFIGFFIVFMRWRSIFSGAVAFSILLGNMVAPIMDMAAAWWSQRRKAAAGTAAGGES